METRITEHDLASNLTQVLTRIQDMGEHFVVERDGEPVAALTPMPIAATITLREVASRLGELYLPGDGFADDLEAIQNAQARAGTPEWPS